MPVNEEAMMAADMIGFMELVVYSFKFSVSNLKFLNESAASNDRNFKFTALATTA